MKDDIYNRFKGELSRYHKRGYSMNYPNSESFYDEEGKENIIHIELAFFKKGKEDKDI